MFNVFLFLLACGFSYLLNAILLRYTRNFGVRSRQAQSNLVRWSSTTKPTTGGISFFITFLVGAIYIILTQTAQSTTDPFLALLLGATLAFLIGFADDAYGTSPGLKFGGQVLCGVILLFFGVTVRFTDIYLIDAIVTVVWVVGLMNSLNMLDNMDAVTTTVALTVLITILARIVLGEALSTGFMLAVVVAGSFCGFLFYNWNPAKIYMGDTGSMFIGFVVAYFGIRYFWNIPTAPDNISILRRPLLPIMVFLVPIMDTTFVTISRIARGGSPWVGGKDHLTHYLAHAGVPESLVPVGLGLVSAISGGLALFAYLLVPEWKTGYSFAFGTYILAVITIFTIIYRRGGRIGRMKQVQSERKKMRENLVTQAKG